MIVHIVWKKMQVIANEKNIHFMYIHNKYAKVLQLEVEIHTIQMYHTQTHTSHAHVSLLYHRCADNVTNETAE